MDSVVFDVEAHTVRELMEYNISDNGANIYLPINNHMRFKARVINDGVRIVNKHFTLTIPLEDFRAHWRIGDL